jgi:hypothetical protein
MEYNFQFWLQQITHFTYTLLACMTAVPRTAADQLKLALHARVMFSPYSHYHKKFLFPIYPFRTHKNSMLTAFACRYGRWTSYWIWKKLKSGQTLDKTQLTTSQRPFANHISIHTLPENHLNSPIALESKFTFFPTQGLVPFIQCHTKLKLPISTHYSTTLTTSRRPLHHYIYIYVKPQPENQLTFPIATTFETYLYRPAGTAFPHPLKLQITQ